VRVEESGAEMAAETGTQGEYEDFYARLLHLWSQFENALQDIKPFKSDETRVIDVMATMRCLISSEKVRRMEEDAILSLLASVYKLREILCPVDLEKLYRLLTPNHAAGEAMKDKDVWLLLGSTGAGKTTTIQFLAGTTFEEVEVDGSFHFKAASFPDPKLKDFHTSSGAASVTKTVQCFELQVDGKSIVLCDVPGFGDTKGTEDIANAFGVIQAIQCAKSVRPILVLSADGGGGRFSALKEVLGTIALLMGGEAHPDTLKTFGYLFTKYEEKYKTLLHKQFAAVKRDAKENVSSYLSVLDDMVTKTNPEAHIVLPLEGDPNVLLQSLLSEYQGPTLDPKHSFSPFVSEPALVKLQLQLQYTKTNLESALSKKHFNVSKELLEQLSLLAGVLPEAGGIFRACKEQ
jgi:energy-coupling factor transporter ATP-binding protein EcfA2